MIQHKLGIIDKIIGLLTHQRQVIYVIVTSNTYSFTYTHIISDDKILETAKENDNAKELYKT